MTEIIKAYDARCSCCQAECLLWEDEPADCLKEFGGCGAYGSLDTISDEVKATYEISDEPLED